MTKTTERFLFLQLFADGAGEAAAESTTGATETDAASQSGEESSLPITYLDEVEDYAPDAGEQQEQEEAPDLDAEFNALIKKGGKYAEAYQRHFQKAIDGRMKASKEQTAQLEKTQKVMQKLAIAYGKDIDDIDGIDSALDADEEIFSNAAAEAGMSVEAYKEAGMIKAENELLKKAEAERVQRAEAEKTYREWLKQADEMNTIYPGFNMDTELQNPTFANLLRNGFSVKNAYEAAHVKEIIPQAMQAAAQQAQLRLSKSYAANQTRPDENAGSRSAAATVKRDVASLTDKELDEIDALSRKRRITLG